MRIWQTLRDQPADQNQITYLLTTLKKTVKENINTPRMYNI
jgi:Iap family predicted aminopeptidase